MISINLNHCSNALLQAIATESKVAENIQQILEFKEEVVYRQVARNAKAFERTLIYLYEKYGEEVAWDLAENTSAPQQVLRDVATKCHEGLAKVLLNNSALQSCEIDIIVERYQELEDIIYKAIEHDNTSASTLVKIANIYPQFAEEILRTGKVKLVES